VVVRGSCFSRENGERSQLTFMVYLNSDFNGGETKFYSDDRHLRMPALIGPTNVR
jgi:hypothetical protein